MAKRVISVNPVARTGSGVQCKCMARQDKSREKRLAQALRENLRKRKAQAWETASPGPVLSPPPGGDEESED
jgi:hypothetical protein